MENREHEIIKYALLRLLNTLTEDDIEHLQETSRHEVKFIGASLGLEQEILVLCDKYSRQEDDNGEINENV